MSDDLVNKARSQIGDDVSIILDRDVLLAQLADRIESLTTERDALKAAQIDATMAAQDMADEITRMRTKLAVAREQIHILDAIKAQIKAETRARVIEEAKAVCDEIIAGREEQLSDAKYDFTMKERFRAGILQTKFVREKIDALHTGASREVK